MNVKFASGFVVSLRSDRNQKNLQKNKLFKVLEKLTGFIFVVHQKQKLKAFIY